MAKIKADPKMEREERPLPDKPAPSLLKSWGKRLSQGAVSPIPVYVGGSWTLQIPRGNKRVLQLAVSIKKN